MRAEAIKFASSGIVGVGIFIVFLLYLERCVALSDWTSLSNLELAILVSQIVRVLLVLGLGKFYYIQPQFSLVLLSLEVFLIPSIGLYTILSGDTSYTVWMAPILTTWIGVSSIVLSPFSIYELTRGMMKGGSLVGVIVMATLESGFMLFLVKILATTDTIIQGPSALGTLLIRIGVSQFSSAAPGNLSSNWILSIGLALFYIGMISYIMLGDHKLGSAIKMWVALIFPLVGTLAVLAWMYAAFSVSSDALLVFIIPTFVGISALWVSSRGS